MNKNNKSGYSGVYFDAKAKKWRAQISLWGKKIKLGTFQTEYEANQARLQAKKDYSLENFTYGNPFDLALAHFIMQKELGIPKSYPAYMLIYNTFIVPSILYTFTNFKGQAAFVPAAIKNAISDYQNRIPRYVRNPFFNEPFDDLEDKMILVKYLCGVSINQIAKEHSISYPTAWRRVEYIKTLVSLDKRDDFGQICQ